MVFFGTGDRPGWITYWALEFVYLLLNGTCVTVIQGHDQIRLMDSAITKPLNMSWSPNLPIFILYYCCFCTLSTCSAIRGCNKPQRSNQTGLYQTQPSRSQDSGNILQIWHRVAHAKHGDTALKLKPRQKLAGDGASRKHWLWFFTAKREQYIMNV